MRLIALLYLLWFVGHVAAPVWGADPGVVPKDGGGLAGQARQVLQQYCHRCHNGGGEGGELDFFKRADLVRKAGRLGAVQRRDRNRLDRRKARLHHQFDLALI